MPRSPRPSRPRRLAAIDRTHDGWSVVVLRADPEPAVESAASFPDHDAAGLAAAVARARPDRVVRLIPLGQSMCRPVPGAVPPDGAPHQVALALDLIAEAQLGATTPVHRRCAGRLPLGGLVATGWSGNGVASPALRAAANDSPTWVPPVAALAALAARAGAGLALAAQRDTGAIAIVAGRHRDPSADAVARITRDDGDDPDEWRSAVRSAIASAASAAGIDPTSADPGDLSGRLAIRLFAFDAPGPTTSLRLPGVPDRDAEWVDHFGLLLGAALAAADDDPASRALLSMTPEPVIPPQPLVLRWIDWLAKPSRAALAISLAVVIILGWPLAASWVRYQRLAAVAKADRADESAELSARQQAEFYQLLRDRRWPMTKLLADLTTSLPTGVTLESVALEYGQRVRVSGTADTNQSVSDWLAALRNTRIFDDLRTPTLETTPAGVKFELQSRVAAPLTVGGRTIATPAVPLSPPAASRPATEPRPAAAAPATDRAGDRRATSTPAPAARAEPPPPLSDADIAAMDRSTAMREFSSRQKFAQSTPNLDDATKARLLDEAAKCRARMQSLPAGGPP